MLSGWAAVDHQLKAVWVHILVIGFGCLAHAADEPMPFKVWKDQQIIDAQNRLARISNRVLFVKSNQVKPDQIAKEIEAEQNASDKSGFDPKRMQKFGPQQLMEVLERDRDQAAKSVEFSKALTLEDYWLVYLAQFQDNPEALSAVASRMSKDEVAQLLKAVLKGGAKGPITFGSMTAPPGNG